MKAVQIIVQPTGTETYHVTSVVLDRKRFRFTFYTNTADGGWYFDLENEDESAVLRGIALASGVDLLEPYRHLDVPPGILGIEDVELDGEDPDLTAFSDGRAKLYYWSEET